MQKKVVKENDGVKKDLTFRKILLNKCQKEFEKKKSVEKTISEKLEDLGKQELTVSTSSNYCFALSFKGFVELSANANDHMRGDLNFKIAERKMYTVFISTIYCKLYVSKRSVFV